ncbi:MAG: purine-binding chemotaxis protein CheW [Clostridiales bacterium]|nr:purine-binding chemotaxis protein CheW [Clostridiales bacterium]
MNEERDEILLEEDTQRNKYLTFSLDEEMYGIEIKYVTEIIGLQAITRVPELPDYIRGIINLRGKIIPLMDVRLRFHKDEKPYDDRTCIIVVDIDDLFIGLIVDTVTEVMNISDQDIVETPDIGTGVQSRFISGIGKVGDEVKLLLDCRNLLSEADLQELKSA